MQNLKNSFYISIIFLFVFLSCSIAQPSYKILKVNEDGIEILLSSNRAYVTCENASGDDKVHILLLHILNDKNTVDDFIHGLAYPKEDCMSLKSAIERVIMNGKQIYLAGSGSGKVNLKYEDESYKFRDLGQFPFSKIVFGFRMIKNEKGQCYRFGVGDEKEESCK